MILPLFSPATFSNKKWTVGKHILWVTFILLTIGSGNYVYTYAFIDVMQWHWKIFILFILFTMVIGIIPVSIVTLIDVNRKLKKNLKTASNINKEIHQNTSDNIDKNKALILRGKNKNETLSIKEDQFYFLCSEGNYVQIYYQEGTDFKKTMLRNTLHNISQQLQNSSTIVQCHRAYMVNTDKIIKAEGNAQGFKLKIKDLSEKIPVSRKFVPTVKRTLAV
jgi:DNA-binding LytR/AlgR family response regulator